MHGIVVSLFSHIYKYTLQVCSTFSFSDTITTCWLYLINDGITVHERSITVEWEGTGAVNYMPSLFKYECQVDFHDYQPCMHIYTNCSLLGLHS